jgi:hypothetical protein
MRPCASAAAPCGRRVWLWPSWADAPGGGGDLGGDICQWQACEVEDEMLLTIAFLGMGQMERDSRMGAAKAR